MKHISAEFICCPINANDEVPWGLGWDNIGATGQTPLGARKSSCRAVHARKELARTRKHHERCGGREIELAMCRLARAMVKKSRPGNSGASAKFLPALTLSAPRSESVAILANAGGANQCRLNGNSTAPEQQSHQFGSRSRIDPAQDVLAR